MHVEAKSPPGKLSCEDYGVEELTFSAAVGAERWLLLVLTDSTENHTLPPWLALAWANNVGKLTTADTQALSAIVDRIWDEFTAWTNRGTQAERTP